VLLWHGGQFTFPPVSGVELRHARGLLDGSPISPAFEYQKSFMVHAACADLFRYEVLLQHGGAYADLDVMPLRLPVEVPPEPRFEQDRRRSLEIRFLAAPAGHELMRALRDEAVRQEAAFVAQGGYRTILDLKNVLERTGPRMAARVARAWAKERGVPYGRLLLPRVVNANTRENRREHYSRRWADVHSRLTPK